jgi:4-carboxymuconolactone decarboxylase
METPKRITGMAIRRKVLGDAHVDRAEASKTDLDAGFQSLITEYAWGMVWAGDGLDLQTRHLVTLALLAGLGHEHEFRMHLRATGNTSVTPEQVREVLHHVAVYAGVPAANSAFAAAKEHYAAHTPPGRET